MKTIIITIADDAVYAGLIADNAVMRGWKATVPAANPGLPPLPNPVSAEAFVQKCLIDYLTQGCVLAENKRQEVGMAAAQQKVRDRMAIIKAATT